MALKAAIIGLEPIAYDLDRSKEKDVLTHARAYQNNAQVDLVAVSDGRVDKTEDFNSLYPEVKTYSHRHNLLQELKPDIVSVCTQPGYHAQVITEVASYRPQVIICEIPISYSIDDATHIVTECMRHDVHLIVNHPRRFDPMHQQIATAVHNGLIGHVEGGNLYYTSGIYQTGSHMFDSLRMIVGEIFSVQAFSEASVDAPDPTIGGRLIFSDKTSVFMHAINVKNYNQFELDLYGTLGRIQIRKSGKACELYLAQNRDLESSHKSLHKVDNPFVTGLNQMMVSTISHAIDVATQNVFNLSDGAQALKTLEVILALRKSYYAKGEVITLSGTKKRATSEYLGYLLEKY